MKKSQIVKLLLHQLQNNSKEQARNKQETFPNVWFNDKKPVYLPIDSLLVLKIDLFP